MTKIVQKSVMAMAVVIGLGLGTAAQVSAGTVLPPHFLPADGGSLTGTTQQERTVDEAVGVYRRHGIGFLAE